MSSAKKKWQTEFDKVDHCEYFQQLTDPSKVSAVGYFRHCSPLSQEKPQYHSRWKEIILPIVAGTRFTALADQYRRLAKELDSADTGFYWEDLEEDEHARHLKSIDRKHQRQLQENAVDQLGMTFEHYSKKTRRSYEAGRAR